MGGGKGSKNKCSGEDYSITLVGADTCVLDGGTSTVAIYNADAADPSCKDISNVTLQYSEASVTAVDPSLTSLYSIGSSEVDVNLKPYNKRVSAGLYGVKIDSGYDTTSFDFAVVFGSEVLDVADIEGSVKAGPRGILTIVGTRESDSGGEFMSADLQTSILGGEIVGTTQERLSTGLRVNNASDDESGFTAYVRHPADAELDVDTTRYTVTAIDSGTTRIEGTLAGGDSADFTIVGNQGDPVDLYAVPDLAEAYTCDNFASGIIDLAGENSLDIDLGAGTPTLIEANDGDILTVSYDLNNFSLVDQTVTVTVSVTGQQGSIEFDGTQIEARLNGEVVSTCIPFYDPVNDRNTGSYVCEGLTLAAGTRSTFTITTGSSVSVTSQETAVGILNATVQSELAIDQATAIEIRVEPPVERVSITLDSPTEITTVSGGTVATSYGIVNNTADTVTVTLNVSETIVAGTLERQVDPTLTVAGNVVAGTITMPSEDVRVATYTFDVPPVPNLEVRYEATFINDLTTEPVEVDIATTLDAGGDPVRAEDVRVTVDAARVLEAEPEQQEYTFASGADAEIRIDVRNNNEEDEEVTFVATASADTGEIRTEEEDPVVTVNYEDGSSVTLICQSQDPDPDTGVIVCDPFTLATDSSATVSVSTRFFNTSSEMDATASVTAEFITANGEAADPVEILIVVLAANDLITFTPPATETVTFDLASGEQFRWDFRIYNNGSVDVDGTFVAFASGSDIRTETDGEIVLIDAAGNEVVLNCVNEDPDENSGRLLCPVSIAANSFIDLSARAVFLNNTSTMTSTGTVDISYVLSDGTEFAGPTAVINVAPADINDLINISAVNLPPSTVFSGNDAFTTFALDISSQFANEIGDLIFAVTLENGISITQGVLVLDETGNEWTDGNNFCMVAGLDDRQDGDRLVTVTCPVAGTQDGAAPTLALFGLVNDRLDGTNGSVTIDASVTLANVTAILDAPVGFAVESSDQRN